jgi:hypothetical protein
MLMTALLLSLLWLGASVAHDQAVTATAVGGVIGIWGCAIALIVIQRFGGRGRRGAE